MLKDFSRSLKDILGEAYVDGVCAANAALTGESAATLKKIAYEKVDCCPAPYIARQEALMERMGEKLAPAFCPGLAGAPSAAFAAAQLDAASPQGGLGCFRVGEDGRLYFAGKSEHYHIPLGHAFPAFRLVENAKRIGIANATHNNTRGYITRLAEASLIAAANGLGVHDAAMDEVLKKSEAGVLSRVINIETGSLAVEAAIKMMLARLYPLDRSDVCGAHPRVSRYGGQRGRHYGGLSRHHGAGADAARALAVVCGKVKKYLPRGGRENQRRGILCRGGKALE